MVFAAERPLTLYRRQLRVRHVPGVPIIAARAWLPGGARVEPRAGESLITGRMLAEGSRSRDWRQIARDAEDRGMAIEAFGSYESIGVSVDALASDADQALAGLCELLTTPSFPEDRFHWACLQAAAELESAFDQPDTRTAYAFANQLYQPHPYGRPLHGSAQDLERLTAEQCATAHRRMLGHGHLIVVTGAIDEDHIHQHLDRALAHLAPPPTPASTMPEAVSIEGLPEQQTVALGPGDQAHVYLGHLTVPRAHMDRPALDLVAVALGAGSGLGGRLTTRIRERDGLAYDVGVGTTTGAGHDPGRLSVYAGTAPRTAARVESAIRDELSRLVDHGLTANELEDARAYLIGSQPFRLETARQWADHLADAAVYDLPPDPNWVVEQWRTLSANDVAEAIRRHIRPDDLRVTIGLPSETA